MSHEAVVTPSPGSRDEQPGTASWGDPLHTPIRWDVVAALVYLGLTQAELWFFQAELSVGFRVVGSVVVGLMAVAVAFRSMRPVSAYFAHGVLIGVATAIGLPGEVYPFGNLFLLATLASVARPPVAWAGLVTGMTGVAIYFLRFGQPLVLAGFTMSLWALAWALGRAAQGRRRELALAHERDLSRANAAAIDARLSLEEQRREIGREVHDLVGHTINVMVVHAGAGRRGLDVDPEDARRALTTIEEVGREALDELDGLLATLSPEGRDRRPLQGLADLDHLVDGVRRAGLDVTVTDHVVRPVPQVVGATVYRVVQEALTNTLKHAAATRVEVGLSEVGEDLVVEIRDDGRGDRGGTGRGLAGMADRLGAHGGSLTYGDLPDGGFHVACSIRTFA